MPKSSHQQAFLQMLYADQYRKWDSPIAPSKGECWIIKKFIVQHLDGRVRIAGARRRRRVTRVLILGATPRYRDLAHSLGAEVTCVDMSLNMILGMRELMKYKRKTEKEIWVRSNWLQMPLAQNHWDYVLGDWVICNLPFKLQPKFLAKISQILKPGGYFITRRALMFRQYTAKDLEQTTNDYLKGKLTAPDIVWATAHLGYNPSNYQNHSTEFRRIARRVIKDLINKTKNINQRRKIKQAWRKIMAVMAPEGMSWTYTPPKILDPIMRKYFKITAIKYGPDNRFKEEAPIYLLKKK